MVARFRHVWTAAQIIDAWGDAEVSHLRIMPGTYDISDTLIIDDDKTIEFLGDVTFQNCYIRTRTVASAENYSAYWNASTTTWGAPTAGAWNRIGGAAWPLVTNWCMFVRDGWYEESSETANDFTPLFAFQGGALATNIYLLCKPTRDVNIRGMLKLEVADAYNAFPIILQGLMRSNLGGWKLFVHRTIGTSIQFYPVYVSACAGSILPEISVADWYASATDWRACAIYLEELHNCVVPSMRVGNIQLNTAAATGLLGIYTIGCHRNQFRNIHVCGLNRVGGGAGDPCYGVYVLNCYANWYEGNTIGLVAAGGGATGAFFEWPGGTGNVNNFIIV